MCIAGDDLKGKVVIVTGATGYIGSSLVDELVGLSAKVVRVSRKKIPQKKFVDDWVMDLENSDSWKKIVNNADVIFHLAGNTSVYSAEKDPESSLKSSLIPVIHLIEESKKIYNAPRVVYASTATVYGMTDLFPVSEDRKPNPVTEYDLHKLFAEQYFYMANQNKIINVKLLRLANVYGPSVSESKSNDRGVLSKVTKQFFLGFDVQAYGGGDYLRDYVYIDDVIRAFISAGIMNSSKCIFNVASGNGVLIGDVFRLISSHVERITGVSTEVISVDWPEGINMIETRNFIGSIEKLRVASGWVPKISLTDGVERLVEFYAKEYVNV